MRNKIQVVPGWDPHRYDKLERKVQRLDTSLLLDYADAAGSGMARAFGDFRRGGDTVSLEEVQEGLMSLWAIVQTLKARAV